MGGNTGSDGASVRFCADEFDLQPMVTAAHVVAQQRWRLIQVHHENVTIAIIIEIPEGDAAAGVWRRDSWPGLVQQFLELSVSQISEDDPRALEWIIR